MGLEGGLGLGLVFGSARENWATALGGVADLDMGQQRVDCLCVASGYELGICNMYLIHELIHVLTINNLLHGANGILKVDTTSQCLQSLRLHRIAH